MGISSFTELGVEIEKLSESASFDFRDIGSILYGLSPSDVAALLNEMLTQIKVSGQLPSVEESNTYLYRRWNFNLLLRFAASGTHSGQLAANELDAFVMNLSSFELEIPVFRCTMDALDLAQRPSELKAGENVRLAPYGVHMEPAFSSILDLDNASRAVPLLIVHSEPKAWSTWTFDRKTLLPTQRISTDIRASRISLALEYLRESKMKLPTGILEDIAVSNFSSQVRWEATKYLYHLDPVLGVRALNRLGEDASDSSIRNAALATLDKLSTRSYAHG